VFPFAGFRLGDWARREYFGETNNKTLAGAAADNTIVCVGVVLNSEWLPDEALKQDRSP
jgi:hypothetical protein